ncbi:uncharacterized protein LOC105702950 [Orussus abietinus]|uniref:uncharacterized protein LOC105702945 n=1 Tax=Orussus abietinus TaxID=222816 RepID=UPI00062545C4|nr:uncharacterized protein LOC105702945 [Orussus abietinus]XP_012286360.1 uncharacterized protein LOC105702950 [Orussus abietinus]
MAMYVNARIARLCHCVESLQNLATLINRNKTVFNKICRKNFIQSESLFTAPVLNGIIGLEEPTVPKAQKKIIRPRLKITLIMTDGSKDVMWLDEAEKVAKRRDVKLMKLLDYDEKEQRPLYKLMSEKEYFQEDVKQSLKEIPSEKKYSRHSVKLISISSNIADHDLGIKIKNINKMLTKNQEVSVLIISQGKEDVTNKILQTIKSGVKEHGKIATENKKGNAWKLLLQPIPTASSSTDIISTASEKETS